MPRHPDQSCITALWLQVARILKCVDVLVHFLQWSVVRGVSGRSCDPSCHLSQPSYLCLQAEAVHRDLRWENVACDLSKLRYYLLDLETCARADRRPTFISRSWDNATLVDGSYTPASDLHCLGLMLHAKCVNLITSSEGKAFLQDLGGPASELQSSAAQLLRHSWISCTGTNCMSAGAQPQES